MKAETKKTMPKGQAAGFSSRRDAEAHELVTAQLSEESKSAIEAMKRVARLRRFQALVKPPSYRYVKCF